MSGIFLLTEDMFSLKEIRLVVMTVLGLHYYCKNLPTVFTLYYHFCTCWTCFLTEEADADAVGC